MNIYAWIEKYKVQDTSFPKSHGIEISVETIILLQKKNLSLNPNIQQWMIDLFNVIGKLGHFWTNIKKETACYCELSIMMHLWSDSGSKKNAREIWKQCNTEISLSN